MTYLQRGSYDKPPIDEALLHFSFSEPLTWNVTTPGRVFEAIKEQYGSDPESQEQMSATFEPNAASANAANLALTKGDTRVIYRSVDRSKFLISEQKALTVGSNKPYDGWVSIRDRMLWAWSALAEVWTFPSISKIAARYINRIVIPADKVADTDVFFDVPIRTTAKGTWSFSSFLYRVESDRDFQTKSITTFASMGPDTEGSAQFLLDLEFQHTGEVADLDDAMQLADELKNLENTEFEDYLSDETRKLFQ